MVYNGERGPADSGDGSADGADGTTTATLDRIFAALAHETRRRLVHYLALQTQPPRMSQVATDNGLSPQLLNKHAAALEKAGLVQRMSVGRESLLVIDQTALIAAQNWLIETRAFWEGQLDSLDAYISELAENGGAASEPAPPPGADPEEVEPTNTKHKEIP